MPANYQKRKLAAILSADIVGYSRLCQKDDGTPARVQALHIEIVKPLAERHGGKHAVLKEGDRMMISFDSVFDAVNCAIEIQREMPLRNSHVASDRFMELRIGINMGDVLVSGAESYGHDVNIAARLESLAKPGGICISEEVRRQVKDKIDADFTVVGNPKLKNIRGAIKVYRVDLPDLHREAGSSLSYPMPRANAKKGSAGHRRGTPIGIANYDSELRIRVRKLESKLKTLSADIEANYINVNRHFLMIAQAKFDFTQKLASYTSIDHAINKNYAKGVPKHIRHIKDEARQDLHDARVASLNEICTHISYLFTDLKGFEVCTNVKMITENYVSKILRYATIASSSNTPTERKNMHIRDGDCVSYPLSRHYALARLNKPDLTERYVLTPSINDVVEKIKTENLKIDFPNQRSTRFFSSALVVPVWHDVLAGLFKDVFTTVVGKLEYKSLNVKRHGLPSKLFGYLTVDAKQENAFNAKQDLQILEECSIDIFDVMFEHFSILFEYPLPSRTGEL